MSEVLGDPLRRSGDVRSSSVLMRLLDALRRAARVEFPRAYDRRDVLVEGLLALAVFVFVAVFWRLKFGDQCRTHDEYSYLLQARTFLSGALAWPTPPLPEFFEAAHVLVEPVYASKYFPGQALLIAPFLALGVPWVGPCLATALSAGLIHRFLRQAGFARSAALVAVGSFALSSAALNWSASYLSHSGAILGTAVGLVALQRFCKTGSLASSAVAVLATSFILLCRPLTGLAFGLVLTGVMLSAFLKKRLSTSVAVLVVIIGAASLVGALWWTHAVTGVAGKTPWALWAEQYSPFDGPGIGKIDASPPRREVPGHFAGTVDSYKASRESYVWSALPSVVALRFGSFTSVSMASATFLVLFFLGFLAALLYGSLRLPLVICCLYFLSTMVFHSSLVQYGSDLAVAVSLLVGGGFHVMTRLPGLPLGDEVVGAITAAMYLTLVDVWWPAAGLLAWGAAGAALLAVLLNRTIRRRWAGAIFFAVLLFAAVFEAPRTLRRGTGGIVPSVIVAFEEAKRQVAAEQGILFVRHRPRDVGGLDLTLRHPRLQDHSVVVAVDRGEDDERLVEYLGRRAWVFDVGTRKVTPWLPSPKRDEAMR